MDVSFIVFLINAAWIVFMLLCFGFLIIAFLGQCLTRMLPITMGVQRPGYDESSDRLRLRNPPKMKPWSDHCFTASAQPGLAGIEAACDQRGGLQARSYRHLRTDDVSLSTHIVHSLCCPVAQSSAPNFGRKSFTAVPISLIKRYQSWRRQKYKNCILPPSMIGCHYSQQWLHLIPQLIN